MPKSEEDLELCTERNNCHPFCFHADNNLSSSHVYLESCSENHVMKSNVQNMQNLNHEGEINACCIEPFEGGEGDG